MLEHHEARGLLDDLHGDDSLAALLKDAGDVGEGSVEESEASGLHVAGPGLELDHRVGIYLEALEVALHLRGVEPLEGDVEVDPVRHAGEVGLDLRFELRLSGDDEPHVGLVEDRPEDLHLLLGVLRDELVRLVDDEEVALVRVEEVPDAVDPAPDSAVAAGDAEGLLDRLHKIAAAHGVVALNVGDPGELRVLPEGVGLAVAAAGDHDAEADVLLTALTHAEHLEGVPALIEDGLPSGLAPRLRERHGLAGALGQPVREELLDGGDVPLVLAGEVAGDRRAGIARDLARQGGDAGLRDCEVVVDLLGKGLAGGVGCGLGRCCCDFHVVPPIRS